MITRIRIETEESSKEEAIDKTALAVSKFIRSIEQDGEWECTQDVVIRISNGPRYSIRRRMEMPARSQAQRRFIYARFGKAWAKRHHFNNKGKLPSRVKKRKKGRRKKR
jgi:hypothetical protein